MEIERRLTGSRALLYAHPVAAWRCARTAAVTLPRTPLHIKLCAYHTAHQGHASTRHSYRSPAPQDVLQPAPLLRPLIRMLRLTQCGRWDGAQYAPACLAVA